MQSHNVGMVQLDHDVSLSLQCLPDVGILDLAESHHLQGNLLLQDDVVCQHHLAEGALAKSGRCELIVADGAEVQLCKITINPILHKQPTIISITIIIFMIIIILT